MKTDTTTAEATEVASLPTSKWTVRAGASLGGYVVGHRALMTGNPNTAYIVGLREEALGTKVLLRFIEAQPVAGTKGETRCTFEVSHRDIRSTWCSAATVRPHLKPTLPPVYSMGSAPTFVPKGYTLVQEVRGTAAVVQKRFAGKHVVLVKSAELHERPEEFAIAVFAWTPAYSRWRHGGWYVSGVTHPNGGSGCVSNNYPDKKWRIVCDPRRVGLGEPGDFTFPNRDAAARAELELVNELASA